MEQGYIKMFRKFFLEHEFWLEDRKYSKAEAWIDLIYCARWGKEPKQMVDKRGSYILEFGDIYISYRYLGQRWRWSKNKVNSFLSHLQKRESISFKKKDSHRTIVNVKNLKTYIEWEKSKKDSEGTVKGQSRDSEGTKKKKGKKVKTVKHKYGINKNVLLTDKQKESLKEKFGEVRAKEWVETLSKGMMLKDYGYTSHYHAILKWSENKQGSNGRDYTPTDKQPCKVCSTTEWTSLISGKCEPCRI